MDAICEEDEDEDEEEGAGKDDEEYEEDPRQGKKGRRYSLEDILRKSPEKTKAPESENEVFARLFAEAAERAEGEAMEALAEMGKEEKKVRKGMEKLGMVPLDGLQHVRVTLGDGTVMMLKAPEVYVLPRHPTNPGPDRVLFFSRKVIDDYDSDEPETPQHSNNGSPAADTLSGFARTLLGKYLQEDDEVEDVGQNDEDEDSYLEESQLVDEDMPEEPGFFAAKDSEEEEDEEEEDDEDDELPPSPVHMRRQEHDKDDQDELPPDDPWAALDKAQSPAATDELDAMGPDSLGASGGSPVSPAPLIPGYEPMSPARKKFLMEKQKAEQAKLERIQKEEVAPPPMTARTATNVATLEALESFVEEQGWTAESPPAPTAAPAAPLEALPKDTPETMFTARDFSHSEVDPVAAVEAAQSAERKAMEDAMASMSPEDRAAVLAAQGH